MKKFIVLLSLLIGTFSFSSENPIIGKWITEKAKNGNQIIVEFYQKNDKYFGEISKLTIPLYEEGHEFEGQKKMDLANQNPDLQKRTLEGIDFVSNFTYDKNKNKFINGNIYNPENGKTYYCSITFKDENTIIVKGSLDKSGFIGSKQIWSRLKGNN